MNTYDYNANLFNWQDGGRNIWTFTCERRHNKMSDYRCEYTNGNIDDVVERGHKWWKRDVKKQKNER